VEKEPEAPAAMIFHRLAAALAAAVFLAQPAKADESSQLASALAMADGGDWQGALATARAAGDISADVLAWRYLREQHAAFADYLDFLERNFDWPGLSLLRKKGEAAIDEGLSPDLVVAFFAGAHPQTGQGSLALARALRDRGQIGEATDEAVRGWRSLSMTPAVQEAFLAEFGPVLSEHHDGRMAAMLWAGLTADARRMLPLASDNTAAVARARISLQEREDGVDALINAVPDAMRDSAGLAFDRFGWRISKDRYAEAGDLLLERSDSAERLGDPEAWADWRRKLARKEMREGDPVRAYRMAARHQLISGDAFEDLEWLSGYIALRKLGDAQAALEHFDRYAESVGGPISRAKAHYWRGRSFDALGRTAEAEAAYAEAARYQTAFYGLLASERIGVPLSSGLAGGEAFAPWQGAGFTGSRVFQAGRLLMQAGDHALAARFLSHLAEGLSGAEIGSLAGMAVEADEPYVALVLAKAAADKGTILPTAYFPLVGLDHLDLPVSTALTLSVARRESEFNPQAVSSVGALGLMQVMPDTGKMMAAKLGIAYDRGKLGSDFDYNARLGSAYLRGLVDEFGPSPLLVATGYNAGPGRSRKWIDLLGDPRSDSVDPVDWIEHIPFRETQIYVMRVAESLPIYRARLTGETGPVAFTDLLRGR
jgi:soluble lytic murein transglycosylase